jgi:hypothetical protein
MEKEVYTAKELQNILGVSRKIVLDIVQSRKFPTLKEGREIFVSKQAFATWLASVQYNAN